VAVQPDEPEATQRDAEALAAQADQFMRLLSGQSPPRARPQPGGFFQPRVFENLSVLRILAGYGLPSLAALVLSLLVFNRRDL
jgi:hypothetical protein